MELPLSLSSEFIRLVSPCVDNLPGNVEISTNNFGNCVLLWDSTQIANGFHTVKLRAVLGVSGGESETVDGPELQVEIFNKISTLGFSRVFQRKLFIDATVNVPATSYTIKVLDSTSGIELCAPLTGAVVDNKIQKEWCPEGGISLNDLVSGSITCEVYLESGSALGNGQGSAPARGAVANSGAGAPVVFIYGRRGAIPSWANNIDPAFVVACGYNWKDSAWYWPDLRPNMREMMRNNVLYWLEDPWFELNTYPLLPEPAFKDGMDGNSWWDNSVFEFRDENALRHLVLEGSLASSTAANFYWWGHADALTLSSKKSGGYPLTAIEVGKALNNKAGIDMQVPNSQHPYRLVILDGCMAYSASWAHAFGIQFDDAGSPWYAESFRQRGLDPQAFVAWTVEIPAPATAKGLQDLGDCLDILFSEWNAFDQPLWKCMEDYTQALVDHGFTQKKDGVYRVWQYKISGAVDLRSSDR